MATAEEKLKERGLSIRHSDNPNRSLIDFSVEDGEDNIAWVWGDTYDDVEWECNHPNEDVEFGDDDEYGTCALCGTRCNWGWVKEWLDEGHDDETGACIGKEIEVRKIGEWFHRKSIGGLIGDVIAEMKEKGERS